MFHKNDNIFDVIGVKITLLNKFYHKFLLLWVKSTLTFGKFVYF